MTPKEINRFNKEIENLEEWELHWIIRSCLYVLSINYPKEYNFESNDGKIVCNYGLLPKKVR